MKKVQYFLTTEFHNLVEGQPEPVWFEQVRQAVNWVNNFARQQPEPVDPRHMIMLAWDFFHNFPENSNLDTEQDWYGYELDPDFFWVLQQGTDINSDPVVGVKVDWPVTIDPENPQPGIDFIYGFLETWQGYNRHTRQNEPL